jgi:hypothetical protein
MFTDSQLAFLRRARATEGRRKRRRTETLVIWMAGLVFCE